MIERIDETIVAISSAPGRSAVGIVRLSGQAALSIANQLTAPSQIGTQDQNKPITSPTSWMRARAELSLGDGLTAPVYVYNFRAPLSYTKQDLIELHTVGSPPLLELIRARTLALGAVAAQPGEFTARAFLNGAIDLASAEAVAGVIRAQTDIQLRASRRQLDGALSKSVTEARDELAELLALVEADIDFAEEPIEFITPAELRDRLTSVRERLHRIMSDSESSERLDVLPRILLLGPPNAGKSSLMNRLSGTNRAICAAVAGTTRDVLSAPIRIGRGEAILLDSAGVDQSTEEIISQARELTLSTAERVDLVCLVIDATANVDDHFLRLVDSLNLLTVIVVLNKCDLMASDFVGETLGEWTRRGLGPACAVSAKTGHALDQLQAMIAEKLGTGLTTASAEAVVLNERQRAALRVAAGALEGGMDLAASATETVDCADVVAFELREALDALGEITGEVTTEDMLSQVFARFCIGK